MDNGEDAACTAEVVSTVLCSRLWDQSKCRHFRKVTPDTGGMDAVLVGTVRLHDHSLQPRCSTLGAVRDSLSHVEEKCSLDNLSDISEEDTFSCRLVNFFNSYDDNRGGNTCVSYSCDSQGAQQLKPENTANCEETPGPLVTEHDHVTHGIPPSTPPVTPQWHYAWPMEWNWDQIPALGSAGHAPFPAYGMYDKNLFRPAHDAAPALATINYERTKFSETRLRIPPAPKRQQVRIYPSQRTVLEEYLQMDPYPSTNVRRYLADRLGLRFNTVNNWFQRMRSKRHRAAISRPDFLSSLFHKDSHVKSNQDAKTESDPSTKQPFIRNLLPLSTNQGACERSLGESSASESLSPSDVITIG